MKSFMRRHPIARAADEGDEGFTLIELLIVLLIIGILMAIAIPTFLSVTRSADDTAAQANLQTALSGAKSYFTENTQSYTGLYSGFGAVDTGLSDVTGTSSSSNPHTISISAGVAPGGGSVVALAAWSPGTENCWAIVDTTASESILGQSGFTGTLFVDVPNVGSSACHGSAFLGSAKPSGYKTSTTGFSSVA